VAGTALSADPAAGGGGSGDPGFFSAQAERTIVAARTRASITERYLGIAPPFLPPDFIILYMYSPPIEDRPLNEPIRLILARGTRPTQVVGAFADMREVHVVNIDRCKKLVS